MVANDKVALTKKGALGVLALLLILTACVNTGEITAKPTVESTINEIVNSKLAEEATQTITPIVTGAISLEDPRPKISEELVKQLKKEKRNKIKVLIDVKDKEALQKIKQKVEEKGGKVTNEFSVGGIAAIELPADEVEKFADDDDILQISDDKQYVALVEDRIQAFGVNEVWDLNLTGKNVKIAILDTGTLNSDKAKSFIEGETTKDQHGHGTHVAGIAKKIAPDSLIYNAKVLNKNGGGTTTGILAGINWAVNPDGDDSTNDGADIISMSFGGMFTELDGPLASAVKEAIEDGVVFVVAAGNCRAGCGGFYGVTTPGNVKEVITVGAVDDNNKVASFSSGDEFDDYIKPDIVAPGVDITSDWLTGTKTLSGTSMSTPFVSGIVALMLEQEKLNHAKVKEKLIDTAVDLGEKGWDTSYGAGLIGLSELFAVDITINRSNETIIPEINITESESKLGENDTINPYEGYYVTIPVNRNNIFSLTANDEFVEYAENSTNLTDSPKEVKVKIPNHLKSYLYNGSEFEATNEQESELETLATGDGYLDYDDDFYYKSSSNDGIIWGGDYLDVEIRGEETNTMVMCWDWCNDGTWDHCFADTSSDLKDCISSSSTVKSVCKKDNGCHTGDMDFEHEIPSGDPGDKWKCEVDARYMTNCGESDYTYYDIAAKPYYVISPRQYDCNTDGTYDDIGRYSSSNQVRINKDLSCGSKETCDTKKDDEKADFGNRGDDAPNTPCSLKNGYGDCDSDTDCLSGNCVESGLIDHCCPSGEGWDGSKCTKICTEKSTGELRCTSDKVQEKYINKDCTETWKDKETCSSTQKCSNNACVDKTCTDYGLSYDSCTSEGSKKKITGKVLECKDQIVFGKQLCWEPIASLGDSDFCKVFKCDYGEYDCDTSSECASGLFCGGYQYNTKPDGCCKTGETWDETTIKCLKPNDGSCTKDSECTSGYCYLSKCKTKPVCGNGSCESDAGESNANCSTDCKLSDGSGCAKNTDCNSGYCHTDKKCRQYCVDNDEDGYGSSGYGCPKTGTDCNDSDDKDYPGAPERCDNVDNNCSGSNNEGNVCCGNGACDYGETKTSCSKDCYGKLQVVEITSAPTEADQGNTVTIKAKVKNEGTTTDTLKIEAGIAPDYWENVIFSQEYGAQSYKSVTKCCTGNEYYDAKEITLKSQESETVTFTVKAPKTTSTDSCYSKKDYKSAWDTSHTVIIGLYDKCGEGYKHKDTQNIKIKDTSCKQPSDCKTGEYCDLTGTIGVCKAKTCIDQCNKGSYSCNGNKIQECIDKDDCYVWKEINSCGTGYACVDGKSTCQDTKVDTLISIEEAGSTTVKKQTGDILAVNLQYVNNEEITLEYDKDEFELMDCSNTFAITKDTKCKFEVKGTSGVHSLRLKNGPGGYVQITDNPKGIIITNKKKLHERFNSPKEVKELLQKSYQYAEKNHLVMYDLNDYIGEPHPWNAFTNYKEQAYNPFMEDNSYAIETAQLIREKCQEKCVNTVILGDDYVVPHYRRDVQFLNNYLFYTEDKTDSIYSDIAYVKRKDKPFSQLDDLFYFKGDYDGKKLVIIKPDSLSSSMSSELDKLKKVLTAKFKPKITEIDASTVKCNDGTFFSKFDGATLLVIGTEKTNLAYNCMPFVTQLESSDSAFIEVNPWDGRNYAIIVNTADSKVLQMFTAFIETEKFKKATSKSLWFIEIGIDTAGYLSLLCTGALVPCDTIVDAASTDFYCAMKGDVVLCAVSAAMMAVPYIPAAPVKQAVKSVVKDAGVFAARVIKDAGEEFVHLVSRAFKRGKLDDLTTLLKAMGKCTFSASGFNIQSGCPGADDFAKLLKSRSRTTVDKAMDAAYTDHELMHRIVRASKENIPDEKFARMLDSELVVNGKNLKNFEPVGDKIRIGTVTDKSGTTYYFKRDQVGVISLTDSNDRERIAYRLNYLLDESDTTVKVPKSRRIKDVSVDGELETGLLTEEIEGTDLMTLYENKKKDWGGGLDGQTKFFKYTKEISDTQKDTMRKQMVRDFMFGANDRNLANAIATKDGKVAFIDFEQTFINNGKISVIFDTPSTVNAMLSNKLDENLLRNYPQYIDLMEKWNWDNPSVQKEILDLLEPEVKKLEKLTAADFEAALQFEKLKGSSVDMQNVKKEIFGTTGNNGRLHDFIKDFKKVKAEVEAKLK